MDEKMLGLVITVTAIVCGLAGFITGFCLGSWSSDQVWKEKLRLPDWFVPNKVDRTYRVYEVELVPRGSGRPLMEPRRVSRED